jgi:hypothetical protein
MPSKIKAIQGFNRGPKIEKLKSNQIILKSYSNEGGENEGNNYGSIVDISN